VSTAKKDLLRSPGGGEEDFEFNANIGDDTQQNI